MPDIQLNGAPRALPAGSDVATAVATLGVAGAGVAVAVNGSVVPRTDWPATALHTGDRVEVLSAAQGG